LFLDPDTAVRWQLGHLLLLPAFPLIAVALFVVLRGERSPAAWGARTLAVAYALLYGTLDTIAGIGAPQQVIRAAERGESPPPINDLFEIGDQLGHLGVYALGISATLAGLVLFLRTRSPLAPLGAAVIVAACYPFYRFHVFPYKGVLAMVAIGVGLALLEGSRQFSAAARTARPDRTSDTPHPSSR
ncbi:MAG: hypothetical protein H7323_16805, partial [Frankiales bacterium]|nr:hypothetical protein [Frankiales bacterium]